MPALPEAKRQALLRLLRAAPEPVLLAIEQEYAPVTGKESPLAGLVREVRLDQAARRLALGPVAPLFAPRADGAPAPRFPKAAAEALWARLQADEPGLARRLVDAVRCDPGASGANGFADQISSRFAHDLRTHAALRLSLGQPAVAEDLAGYFDLAPLARDALPHLSDWLDRPNPENLVVLRLAFKDAAGLRPDGAARLLELLTGHMAEAGKSLRLIAQLTDGGRESYVRSSELAGFAERLLEFIEAHAGSLDEVATLSEREAIALSERLSTVCKIAREFRFSIELDQHGLWSKRLNGASAKLARGVERYLQTLPPLGEAVLPMRAVRVSGRVSRRIPDMRTPLDAQQQVKLQVALALLARLRDVTSALGCDGLRQRTTEALASAADAYAEEGLTLVRAGEQELDIAALSRLEAAIRILSSTRNPESGDYVRRRIGVLAQGPSTLSPA